MNRLLLHAPEDRFLARRVRRALAGHGFDLTCVELGPEATLAGLPVGEPGTGLAVGVSPEAVRSRWITEGLLPLLAGAPPATPMVVVWFRDSALPGSLRALPRADVRPPRDLEGALAVVTTTLIEGAPAPAPEELEDVAPRPKIWHCIFCGWRCDQSYNAYRCHECSALRPFVGGQATVVVCPTCDRTSLAVASYCEWCGHAFG